MVILLGFCINQSWGRVHSQLKRPYGFLSQGDEKLLELLFSSLGDPAEEISVILLESDEEEVSRAMKSMKPILGAPRFLAL